jgi:hypothetical protein
MATIYSLETDGLIWYVGSTTQPPGQRFREHRCKKDKTCGGALIPTEYAWEFKILEKCSVEVREERENYWYFALKPFYNCRVPYSSRAETLKRYRETNRERIRERGKLWARNAYAKKKAAENPPDS